MSTIATLATDVVQRMGARTDITTRAQYWVFEALNQLTSNIDFEELEVKGPNTSLTASTDTYNYSAFAQVGDNVQTAMDFVVYTDSPSATTQTFRLRETHFLENDKITPLVGAYPVQWSRIGLQALFRPVPNLAYIMFMRYRKAHPLTGVEPYPTTTILTPIEWDLIIKYLAMVGGYDELKEHDRAATLQRRIWGGKDPTTGIDQVGMVEPLLTKRQREMPQYDIPLRPANAMTRTCPM